jgi:hypothetical protein
MSSETITYEDSDLLRIPTKSGDVLLYPLKGEVLVEKSKILQVREQLLTIRKAKHIQSIVYTDDDDVLVGGNA